MGSCSSSTVALNNDKQQENEKKLENGSGVAASALGDGVEKSVVSGVFHRQRLLNLMSYDVRNSGSSAWNGGREVAKTKWYERALVFAVQGVFFNAYFVTYIFSPKLAHRIVVYLEEEDIHSYTQLLKELGNGNIENVPAPTIAIDYWHLPKDSTLRDVIVVVWAD
ncbi:Ubiquinol oxidase 1, mitochondrial [Capsicum baccatum]|uniref:Ubiquinol oxidase n=1 Tax=Capsicum baccatum TaxID=33114 RepID=A0A2G2V8C6_CAPBA|nr:Ubiquinol oxidase 1, mitochondrial [Capsicum baccatum]